MLIPLYDNEDSVCGICFNGEYFYFQKNLQGDIISVTDKDANEVAKYTYDAWGVCTIVSDTSACNIATVNPFRYRGYYYDNETRMYYLQSRYYNPHIGRFVNSDDVGYMSRFGMPVVYNLFAYCDNSPSNMTDSTGYKGRKQYNGVVGFGVQILLSANALFWQGFAGAEALWFAFTKNNNFGNGLIPWCYGFTGGSMGMTVDFGKLLSKSFINNPKNVLKAFGVNFSVSVGITFFLITAKKMCSPNDYTRHFVFDAFTIAGVTISKAYGSNISTYGAGFTWAVGKSLWGGLSLGKLMFGAARGASYYWALPVNRNARELYSMTAGKV